MMKKTEQILFLVIFAACAQAAYHNTALNISAAGSTSSGVRYENTGAIIPIGGQVSCAGTLHHTSGAAAGFILQPHTAFGSLPDELNPDNDQDGLDDSDEVLVGSSLYDSDTDDDGLSDLDEVRTYGTSPVLADTDSDGMNDDGELIAGTSPTNRASILEVNCEVLSSGKRELSWFGVIGRAYIFQYCDELTASDWQSYPFELSGSGATVSMIDSSLEFSRFYRVEVRISE